jgi:hypothetical protein
MGKHKKGINIIAPKVSSSEIKLFTNQQYLYLKQKLPFEKTNLLLKKYTENKYLKLTKQLLAREKDVQLPIIDKTKQSFYDMFYSIEKEKDRLTCLALLRSLT